jgi:VWFA-related protein
MRLLAAIALLCTGAAVAQTTPAAPPQTPSFRAQSTLVLVPSLVKDKAGKPVFTLTAGDFTVTDNGVPQKIKVEEDTDSQPLALVVAIETGAGGARQLDNYGNLPTLIEALVGDVPHRAAVVGFDSQPHLMQDFNSDWNVVAGAVQSLEPGDNGAAILDSVAYSVDLLRKQPPEYRRAILLISETIDRGSHIGLAEAVRSISDTNTIIYSVAFSSTKSELKRGGPRIVSDDRPGPPHGCMGKDPDNPDQNKLLQAWNCLGLLAPPLKAAQLAVMLGMDGLRRNAPESIAKLTGGEYYKFNNAHSLENALVTISNRVPNRYVLSFSPTSPEPGPHALEVRLKGYSGLTITARGTYWIDSPDTAAQPAVNQ